MKPKPKLILPLLISLALLFSFQLFAQPKTKKRDFKTQLETGLNYSDFLGKAPRLNGFGRVAYQQPSTFKIRPNLFLGVKGIVNNKHCVKISYSRFESSFVNFQETGLYFVTYKMFGLGYGYKLPLKPLSITLSAMLQYRAGFYNMEYVIFEYPHWEESFPKAATYLRTNIIGFSPGVDIDYFFTKNIGLGLSSNYNYFPSAKSEAGYASNYPPKLEDVASYKPIKEFVTLNFKLLYKFSWVGNK